MNTKISGLIDSDTDESDSNIRIIDSPSTSKSKSKGEKSNFWSSDDESDSSKKNSNVGKSTAVSNQQRVLL